MLLAFDPLIKLAINHFVVMIIDIDYVLLIRVKFYF